MPIKVMMKPHVTELAGESGINRVVENYFRFLPDFGVELVEPNATTYDLIAAHAGITGGDVTVAHTHGIYFTNDYPALDWEYRVNARVIEACRHAKIITCPSAWVAETFQRDMRLNPVVVPHGIVWEEWQHKEENKGYVLWNKNRTGLDVCDNSLLDVLMKRFPDIDFVSTLLTPQTKDIVNSPMWPKNFRILPHGGKTPHKEMMGIVQRAGIYLSLAKETWGIGIVEAMASGVPVLGWNWGGNTQLVQTGVNGYLAEPYNIDDLCEGLNYCLKHRQVLGANGRELAKQWTWQKACEMVAGVYRLAMVEQPATVSVVIPVYNKPKEQLNRAIESCLGQTYKPSQITVVNDGSSNGEEIRQCVAGFKNTDILYIEQSNQGVAAARNNGISHADSKYITCLDADDWLEPTFLEVCVKELEADRTLGIAYTGLRAFNSDGSNIISPWPGLFEPDKQLNYPKHNQIPTANVFRREAWERVGGYKSKYCPYGAGSEDAALWSAICSIGYNAKLVDEAIQVKKAQFDIIRQQDARGIKDYKPTNDELKTKVTPESWVKFENCLFNHTTGGTANKFNGISYPEIDWLEMYPSASDGLHPFASVATPKKYSHAVSQYDQPVISVIIPVGPGHEKEVANALDSLEMQHFRKWEAVVIFDCDYQKAKSQIFSLAKAYPYIRLGWSNADTINFQPAGAGQVRNQGAKASRAPLLFFLDADDVLASPDALQKMLDAWNREQAIIYPEYLGKAVWNYEEAKKTMGDKLLDYNHKYHTAVFEPKRLQGDYNCEVAQRQPEYGTGGTNMPYYNWATVSVLIPKAWHNAIGGFDEDMPTWEDVDYHWRLARAGYCYYRIEEPLIVYNYHKGNRREASAVRDEEGRQKHKSLIQYIKRKYEDLKPVGCNCGGRRNNGATIASTQAVAMSDENFVKVEFDFPGSDTRSTYGRSLLSPTKQPDPFHPDKVYDYKGYSLKKGDTFLAFRADQRARPDMFKLIPDEVILPETQKVELPEPQLIAA